jgi:GT2 family glycosyltransferase
MPTDYDADILILSLDRVEETLAAIGSALGQEGVRRRVIVLDQGSRPGNFARLEECAARHADVVLMRAETNLGVAGGRNRAALLGDAPVIVGLDNDAEFADPHCVARAVAALDAEPALAALGFRIVRFEDGADDLSSWGYPRALLDHADGSFDSCTFVGAGHAIRRAAWDQVGGYDPALFFCWEEFDFCLSALTLGWRVRYRGDITVRHKVSAEGRFLWSDRRWFHFLRNRLYIGRKHGAGWPALLARWFAYTLRGLRNFMLLPSLRALPAAWHMARNTTPAPLNDRARTYLRRHDTAHRGTWARRLRTEILALLPGHRAPG